MKATMQVSQSGRYAILAAFGATFGIIAAIIFLLVYYGQQFSVPVPDTVRMRSALAVTIAICLATVAIYFRNEILGMFREPASEPDEDDAE